MASEAPRTAAMPRKRSRKADSQVRRECTRRRCWQVCQQHDCPFLIICDTPSPFRRGRAACRHSDSYGKPPLFSGTNASPPLPSSMCASAARDVAITLPTPSRYRCPEAFIDEPLFRFRRASDVDASAPRRARPTAIPHEWSQFATVLPPFDAAQPARTARAANNHPLSTRYSSSSHPSIFHPCHGDAPQAQAV